MRRKLIETNLERITYILEILIAIAIIIGIVIGLKDFLLYFGVLLNAPYAETYDVFQSFLGYSLLLVVGVELILMIVNHSTQAVLELILFVIARKMLIYAHSMLDLVFGTIAILIVFFVLKYLTADGDKDQIRRNKNQAYNGSTLLQNIEDSQSFEVTGNIDNLTIGDFVQNLAEKEFRPIGRGEIFYSGSKKIVISKEIDGLVNEVIISDRNDE